MCDVWKVRSLHFQVGSPQKERRLADGLGAEVGEVKALWVNDLDTFTSASCVPSCLRILCQRSTSLAWRSGRVERTSLGA